MKKGFTLIELLTVVLIVGILSAVALPQYQTASAKARVTEALVQLKAITDAQEIYYMANGKYTNDLTELGIETHKNGYVYTKYYFFECVQNRTCVASPRRDFRGPVLEFTLLQDVSFKGKHWCHALTEADKRLCQTLGVVDAEYGNGKYFLLN